MGQGWLECLRYLQLKGGFVRQGLYLVGVIDILLEIQRRELSRCPIRLIFLCESSLPFLHRVVVVPDLTGAWICYVHDVEHQKGYRAADIH